MLKGTTRIVLIIVCIAGILMSGCTEVKQGITTPTPRATEVTVPETPTLTQTTETTATTQAPVLSITISPTKLPDAEECPNFGSSPVPKPITLNGTGDGLVFFEAVAPGKVNITVSTTKVKSCTDEQMGFKLVGKSTCNSIERTFSGGTTTPIDLPNGGKYSITIRGCKGWKIIIKKG